MAHSNGGDGLAVNKRLGPDHGIIGCSTYSPRVDPRMKRASPLAPMVLDTFVGYKNRRRNVIVRSTSTEIKNFALGESLAGIVLNRNMLDGYQVIENTIIVARTPNKGVVTKARIYSIIFVLETRPLAKLCSRCSSATRSRRGGAGCRPTGASRTAAAT